MIIMTITNNSNSNIIIIIIVIIIIITLLFFYLCRVLLDLLWQQSGERSLQLRSKAGSSKIEFANEPETKMICQY